MATKTLKTRIKLKHDSFEKWSNPSNQYRLLKGEIACATIDRADPANKKLPPVMFKVGDGEHTFNELTWASALAADVYDWAKAASKPSYTHTEVGADKSGAAATAESNAKAYTDQKIAEIPPAAEYTLEPGTNNGTLKLTVDGTANDNIAVTGLKSAAYRESTEFATAAQGTRADNAMPKSGGTATGNINFVAGYTAVLGRDPVANMEAATKQYVDTEIGKIDQFKYTISTNAATTPKDVIWYNGATKVTGTLVASADTEYNIYLVPCKHTAAQEQEGYDEYLTVKSGSTYSWEVLGNTRDIDLSGYAPTSRKINNKALTADITLAAADVGVNETAFPGLNKVGTVTSVSAGVGLKITGTASVTPKVEIDEAIEFIFDCGSATVNIEE